MGLYESKPDTKKTVLEFPGTRSNACCAYMQGWSKVQEETQVMWTNNVVDLYAVIDGHGGKMVAQFISDHLVQYMMEDEDFQNQRYEQAIKNVCQKLEKAMKTEAGQVKIQNYCKNSTQSQPGDEKFCGAVMNLCIITETHITFSQLGNARTVTISDFNQKPKEHLQPHDWTNNNEIDRLDKLKYTFDKDTKRIQGIINVSRTLGDFDLKKYNEPSTVAPEIIQFVEKEEQENVIDFQNMGSAKVNEREYQNFVNGGEIDPIWSKPFVISDPDIISIKRSELESKGSPKLILMGSDSLFERYFDKVWKEFMLNLTEYRPPEDKKAKPRYLKDVSSPSEFKPFLENLLDKQIATEESLKDGLGGGNMTAILIKLR